MKSIGTWLRADVQAHIEPFTIPLIKLEVDNEHTTNIIKVKIHRNPSSAASEMHNIKINTFNDVQPEEFLSLLNNFNIATDGIGTTTTPVHMNYL